ncbi:GlxA family transcriptional regulator [Mesorhizobium sp. VK25A]|uniref:GlxA family transcriptional regulator n=1 Tax=Mesorhizobium vachelliae TaxID=3072309 RepID=A0ABU5AF55_9HYPH|nr:MULTISPECIES: GlxA family transcriptional regulator [unclassified Mesorhizobium]MDX8535906.1 GlxA family transcriptional regulator [Mesorhizobium sp. VK25D]MDX8548668.1 GlxA family transcriptional regulator [Mesorhizobium sp. VK25A]
MTIAVLVLPGFSHLALHAYLEPLHIANSVLKEQRFRWRIAGMDCRPVAGANGIAVPVEVTIDMLRACVKSNEIDQLVVVSGEPVEGFCTAALNSLLRDVARCGVGISAIGTATWLLARAGLLTNSHCTIHWSRFAAFSEVFRKPRIQNSLFVKDGQYSTCAGELAAFDLAVDFIGAHAGAFIAKEVCRYATVEGQRSGSKRQTDGAATGFGKVSNKFVAAITTMEQTIEFPVPVFWLSKRIGISRRQLERLFVTHVGMTPAKYYLKVRIDHARRLIEGTQLPIVDVAIASGFVSASHFAKCFRNMHGISPQECRAMAPTWVVF